MTYHCLHNRLSYLGIQLAYEDLKLKLSMVYETASGLVQNSLEVQCTAEPPFFLDSLEQEPFL